MKLKKKLLSTFLLSVMFCSVNAQMLKTDLPTPTAEESRAFLENNKSKKGVMVTPSGLQYKILKSGDGEKPMNTDKVSLKFSILYVNGKVLNESYLAKPWIHHLDKALAGMREAVMMMPVGSKWELYLPANLAFGEAGVDEIPAGTAVVCETEVVGILN